MNIYSKFIKRIINFPIYTNRFYFSSSLNEADKLLIHSVTDFWYGAQQEPGWDRHSKPKQWNKKWFAGGPETDKLIQFKFQKVIEAVGENKLQHWKNDRQGRLAIIILCDQFSRNCYRGSEKAFAFDGISLNMSKYILGNQDMYNEYKIFEKNFILMSFMHSEDKDDSQTSVKQYGNLIEQAKAEGSTSVQFLEFALTFAKEHKGVLDMFGRYPTRNKFLGRQNTPDEAKYLENPPIWGK